MLVSIVDQRIIDTGDKNEKIKVSYLGTGHFINGIDVTELWNFVNTHRPNGIIEGIGQGMLKIPSQNNNNETAVFSEGYGRGFVEPDGNVISYHTAQLYIVPLDSDGPLTFLNKLVGIAYWKVDNKLGNYSYSLYNMSSINYK